MFELKCPVCRVGELVVERDEETGLPSIDSGGCMCLFSDMVDQAEYMAEVNDLLVKAEEA